MLKPEVHRAMCRLKAFLEQRHANVSVVYLPPGTHGSKVGLDDFFAAGHGVQELLEHASRELKQIEDGQSRPLRPPIHNDTTGITLMKPTKDGVVPTPLTNFTARIIADIIRDDGAESERAFEIQAVKGQRSAKFTIPVCQFSNLNWPIEHLGASAIIYSGFGHRDHARGNPKKPANMYLSATYMLTWAGARSRTIVNYLHSGGAIGMSGQAEGIEVNLPARWNGTV